MHLNRGKKKEKQRLYQLLKNLPLAEYEEDYLKNYNELIKNKEINEDLKSYLNQRQKQRYTW